MAADPERERPTREPLSPTGESGAWSGVAFFASFLWRLKERKAPVAQPGLSAAGTAPVKHEGASGPNRLRSLRNEPGRCGSPKGS